jgi:hypothetical protein
MLNFFLNLSKRLVQLYYPYDWICKTLIQLFLFMFTQTALILRLVS